MIDASQCEERRVKQNSKQTKNMYNLPTAMCLCCWLQADIVGTNGARQEEGRWLEKYWEPKLSLQPTTCKVLMKAGIRPQAAVVARSCILGTFTCCYDSDVKEQQQSRIWHGDWRIGENKLKKFLKMCLAKIQRVCSMAWSRKLRQCYGFLSDIYSLRVVPGMYFMWTTTIL